VTAACGVVALGDSITNGRGEPALGVHPQSWAQWLAEGLDVPFRKLARDGACAPDVLSEQVPRLRGRAELGCVYVGVNDCRRLDWDAAAFEHRLRTIVTALGEHAERVLLCTIPHDLGRPRAAPKPAQAGDLIRAVGREAGAVVVDLDDLAGPPLVLPDAVHPTALGQLEIAARAAAALRAAGVEVPRDPREIPEVHRSVRARATFGARYTVQLAKDLRRRAVERVRAPAV
jgi:lysophospholipase L1-like esterase